MYSLNWEFWSISIIMRQLGLLIVSLDNAECEMRKCERDPWGMVHLWHFVSHMLYLLTHVFLKLGSAAFLLSLLLYLLRNLVALASHTFNSFTILSHWVSTFRVRLWTGMNSSLLSSVYFSMVWMHWILASSSYLPDESKVIWKLLKPVSKFAPSR